MKKLLLLIPVMVLSFAAIAQPPLQQITRNYFRSDPFATNFSSFLEHLLNDPDIGQKKIVRRSDSSLFYFEGIFGKYNPFFTRPSRVEISLSEVSLTIVDSLPADTIFTYQLFAVNELNDNGKKQIKKEFEKIHRYWKKKFPQHKHSTETPEGMTGELYNYFLPNYMLAPFTLAWYEIPESQSVALVITVRFKQRENEAVLVF